MTGGSAAAPPKLVFVDGTNSLYRAFFAIPPLRAPDGTPTNAAYGFVNMLAKVIREEAPDRVVVVFDPRGPTFRDELYGAYKANREAQPEDLEVQLPIVHELVEAFRIPIVSLPGFEADDVIATLVERAPRDAQIAIVSTDKDLMQLVSDRVTLLDGVRDRRYGPAEVEQRFGVPPERILDLRALVGDPSDNIPGVKGIGEKGAAELIAQWQTLENLIEHRSEIRATRARNALESQVEQARLSKRLATLRTDAPVPAELESEPLREPDRAALRALYERLGFARLLEALDSQRDRRASRGEATAPERDRAAGDREAAATERERATHISQSTPLSVVRVRDGASLDAALEPLQELAQIPLLCVAGARAPLAGGVAGVAIGLGASRAAYLAIGSADGEIPLELAAERLRPLFQGASPRAWIACDAKLLQIAFGEVGLELPAPAFDAGIAAQLLDPAGANAFSAIASRELGRRVASWEELAGRGAKARPAHELATEELALWAGEQLRALLDLHPLLSDRLKRDGLSALCDDVELPLTGVLARMQRTGVRIDEPLLEKLSEEWGRRLETIEAKIYELAGERFLISSPKQLQKILFEKLKLPAIKKTKTGYSTDEGVLVQLAAQHDLPAQILAYRQLAKLRSTYVDALPPLVNPATGRIHPTFHQLGAATGRLSSADPNVQNIPIRGEEGIRIREAFIPAEGTRLLSADYSQVELRILAHFSDDAGLLQAFERGEDIHRRTAAEIAGIDIDAVSPDQRAHAKAVNFGILYGLSAFGLANQLGIASAEAQATIDAYFDRYRGVRDFIDRTLEQARERGFVQTLLGRRRYLPDLGSRNRTLRQAAERMAVNSVIQGTAADLIKKAMVDISRALEARAPGAQMILQVHDELVFEVLPAQLDALRELVVEHMEGVWPLRVRLRVEVVVGANWREAH
ncbi:MAG TPA: DNA polymerase I [Myxococcota bacterium]|nr:DNA polymerase I [Myxococcota bacterium]